MKSELRKWFVWVLAVCLTIGCLGVMPAMGETSGDVSAAGGNASLSDFEILEPLMDLVVGAMLTTSKDDPMPVPGADGTLDPNFVTAFFALGECLYPSMNITQDILADTEKQAQVLGTVFAAKAPELAAITPVTPFNGYLGFQPVTVNMAADSNGIQIMGEMYWAKQPIKTLTDADFAEVDWQECAIFTFERDATALNGFRLVGFSAGTELDMEQAIQNYFDTILVEYVNTALGFSVQYPSIFPDELLVEDGSGVSVTLPDQSAAFFAKRVENTDKVDLLSYVTVIANGIPGARYEINEEFQYATMTYTTAEGNTVFDVFIVTDRYVYWAELSYQSRLNSEYHLYTTYLENTFMVDEVSVG